MLPDFPQVKRHISSLIDKAIQARVRKDPLISRIHIREVKEGGGVEIQSPGFQDHIEYESVGFEEEVPLQEIIDKGPAAYIERALRAAEFFIEAHHKMLISRADKVTQKSGMFTDAKGKPFSPELLLEALEKMELSFDPSGNVNMPTLVMAPKLAESVKEKLPQWENDPELEKRLSEIVSRKREAWIDRENSRKLVD